MEIWSTLYVHPMLKNHVNGCHGNHAFFIVQSSLSLRTKNICISGILMNDLITMKNCPGVQGRPD